MKSLKENAQTTKDQVKGNKEKILRIVKLKIDERKEYKSGQRHKVYSELHSELRKQHDEIKEYLSS